MLAFRTLLRLRTDFGIMRRTVTLILAALLLLLQYPLWLGKGGWLKVWDLNRQVDSQQQINQQTQTRNAVLDAEVRDLKQGTAAIEERARSELGMIKRDEVFYQVLENPSNRTTEKRAALLPASAVSAARK
jgi:cell division protein FtsB